MGVGDLYGFVLVLVLIGILIGIGVTVLGKLAASTGVSGKAETAVNNTIDAISPIASDWLPIIVIVAVMAIILGMVLAFRGMKR